MRSRSLVVVFALCAAVQSSGVPEVEPAHSYPKRSNDDAALLEWGSSAIIHNADGVVARFGPAATHPEFELGVEAELVTASPRQGCEPLGNARHVATQIVVMYRGGCDFGTKARHAARAGAAALIVVNNDRRSPDRAFAMAANAMGEAPAEEAAPRRRSQAADSDAYDEAADDISRLPAVMISYAAGQQLREHQPRRMRLFAGGGRPFIESVTDAAPVLYLVHNAITPDEMRAARSALEPLLRKAARHTDPEYARTAPNHENAPFKGAVVLMCVNGGNLDLLLNFVLSACARGIDVANLVVFAADASVERALRAADVAQVFRHEALGDFAPEAARNYGDHQFVELMWLKLTCVFLVTHLGYDALFQDADLVWWRSPWPFFAARPDIDTFWMDDGARTSRFAPHFPNTGYYLIRANDRTRLFQTQLLGGYSTVLAWQSHQALVSQLLAEMQAAFGLTVMILDKELFPSGKQLHHNRPLFDRIHAGTFTPYCFHMCWTAGKVDKLKFLKQENLWYLPDRCSLSRLLEEPDRLAAECARSTC